MLAELYGACAARPGQDLVELEITRRGVEREEGMMALEELHRGGGHATVIARGRARVRLPEREEDARSPRLVASDVPRRPGLAREDLVLRGCVGGFVAGARSDLGDDPCRDDGNERILLKPVDNVLRKRFTDPSGLGVVVEIPKKGINLKSGLTKFTPHSTVLSERRERQADHDFRCGWIGARGEISSRLSHGCGG